MESKLRRILRVTTSRNKNERIDITLKLSEIPLILTPISNVNTEKVIELLAEIEPHRAAILSKAHTFYGYERHNGSIRMELTEGELFNLSIVYACRISRIKFEEYFCVDQRDELYECEKRLREFDKFWSEPISDDLCEYADEWRGIDREEHVHRAIITRLAYTGISINDYHNYYIELERYVLGVQDFDIIDQMIKEKSIELVKKSREQSV